MVPLENISLHLHFTLFYIISLPSSSCTSLLYSSLTIPYSHAPLQCLHHFHCSILPSILSSRPLFIFPYFSAALFSHPTRSLYLSIIHYTLFLLLIPPLSLSTYLFTYLSPLLFPPLSPTSTSYTLHSISFSFYNFLSLTLSPLPFTSPLMSAPSLSSFIAFPADLIDCPSVVLHDFGLSEFTCDDSDIIGVLG